MLTMVDYFYFKGVQIQPQIGSENRGEVEIHFQIFCIAQHSELR